MISFTGERIVRLLHRVPGHAVRVAPQQIAYRLLAATSLGPSAVTFGEVV
jgi:hypothetical protein